MSEVQHWLYRGIGEGLGNVAGGDYRAVMVAMAAADLVRRRARADAGPREDRPNLLSPAGSRRAPRTAFANGAILALTHVGLAVALVLAGLRGHSAGRSPTAAEPLSSRRRAAMLVSRSSGPTCSGPRSRIAMTPSPKVDPLRSRSGMIPCPLTTFVLS